MLAPENESNAMDMNGNTQNVFRKFLVGGAFVWFLICLVVGLSRLTPENLRPIDFDTLGYMPALQDGRIPQFWQHPALGFLYLPFIALLKLDVSLLTALCMNFACIFFLNSILYSRLTFLLTGRLDAALFAGGLYCIAPVNQYLLATLEDNILSHCVLLWLLILIARAMTATEHGRSKRVVYFTVAVGAVSAIAYLVATSALLWLPFVFGAWLYSVRKAGVSLPSGLYMGIVGVFTAGCVFIGGSFASDLLADAELGNAMKMQVSIFESHANSLNVSAFKKADPRWAQLRSPEVRGHLFLAGLADAQLGYFQISGRDLFREASAGFGYAMLFLVLHFMGLMFLMGAAVKRAAFMLLGRLMLLAGTLFYFYSFIYFYADIAYHERHDFYILLLPFLIALFPRSESRIARWWLPVVPVVIALAGILFLMTSPRRDAPLKLPNNQTRLLHIQVPGSPLPPDQSRKETSSPACEPWVREVILRGIQRGFARAIRTQAEHRDSPARPCPVRRCSARS